MNGFAGTGALVRLALRRDRIMLPVWLAVFVITAAGSASATVGLYPDEADRIDAAKGWNQAQSLIAMHGRIYDPTSIGALATVKLSGIFAILVAVLAILLTVRHSRAEEEAGRLELLGATVVGRKAPLTASLIVTMGAYLVLGVLTGLGLVASGLSTNGSFAFGFAWAGVGIAFAAIAAVTAQLVSGARAANGLAVAILGLVYILRAIGDSASVTGPRWLTWLSPIGWGQQFRPFAGNRWWVLLVTLGFAAAATLLAYALAARRDLDAGLLPDRPGRATAKPSLRSPLALAWRLQGRTLLGWAAGFLVAGLAFGNITSNIGSFVESPQARDFFARLGGEKGLIDMYLAAMLGLLSVAAAAYGVQAAMRLHTEETALRAEPVLATGATRSRWLLSHTVLALGGTAVLMAVLGAATGLAYGARIGDLGQVGRVLVAALVQIPAAWVLTGIVVAMFGLAPRLAMAGWAAFVAFLLLGELGPMFKLKQWVMDISPFAHSPKLPGASLTVTPVITLTAVAALLTAVGVVAFRRRDIG